MSGYRQHGFDPNAYEHPGRPFRPFNWVQWLGVALATVGIILQAVYFAGLFGWIEPLLDRSLSTFLLLLLGIVLINSRREPSTLVGTEQLEKNRKLLLISIAICAAILGVATAIEFTGAN